MDGVDPDALAIQMLKSNKDYFICENRDITGCEHELFELEPDGRTNDMEWDLAKLQPLNGFCNWQIKVKGIDPSTSKLSDPELSQYVVTLSIESQKAEFALVSAADKEFDFGESGSETMKTYTTMTLERAAMLDLHIIASQPAILERPNFNIKIIATVHDLTAMGNGGIISIIILILIVGLAIAGLLLQAMGKYDFVKRCRPKPPTEIELQQAAEKQAIRDAIEASVTK